MIIRRDSKSRDINAQITDLQEKYTRRLLDICYRWIDELRLEMLQEAYASLRHSSMNYGGNVRVRKKCTMTQREPRRLEDVVHDTSQSADRVLGHTDAVTQPADQIRPINGDLAGKVTDTLVDYTPQTIDPLLDNLDGGGYNSLSRQPDDVQTAADVKLDYTPHGNGSLKEHHDVDHPAPSSSPVVSVPIKLDEVVTTEVFLDAIDYDPKVEYTPLVQPVRALPKHDVPILAPEKIYRKLCTTHVGDRATLYFIDKREIYGALVFNRFRAGGRIINIEKEISVDFDLFDLANVRL